MALSDWRVRGLTRNPSSEAAQALAAKGVEIVKADLDDRDSLIPAFEGASVIFANTDFFALLFKAAAPGGSPPGKGPKEQAFDLEVAQNVNIAAAAASPTVIKTLERFVLSSLSDASKWSRGKYTTVYHFDSKAEAIRTIQAKYPEVAARMSTLQIGHYVTNWKAFHLMAPQKQPDGSFLTIRPNGPNVKFPFIATQRDTGAYVKALVDVPPGKDVIGVSENLTWPEWMDIWGKVLGVNAGFKQVSWDEFFKDVPEPLRSELQDAWQYFEEFGHTGGDPNVLTPDQVS